MRRDCKKFNKQEKHLCWYHFCKKMDASSCIKKMDLPNDFQRKFKCQIGDNVELKGPSGNMWRVGVLKSSDKLTFQSGWKDFVIANNIKANDLLVFKYSGNSSFQVQIFGPSGCERTSSFFSRIEEIEVQESSDSSIKVFDGPDCNMHQDKITISGSSSDLKILYRQHYIKSAVKVPRGWLSNSSSDSEYSTDGSPVKIPRGQARREASTSREPNGRDKFEVLNNERIIFPRKDCLTLAQKERVLTLSEGIQGKNHCFAVPMKPTMITGSFRYAIPINFARKFLPQHAKDAILHYQGCKWLVSIYYSKRTLPHFSAGWRQFVKDSNLKLGDICLFELMKNKKSLSFKVHISRN